ncbi:MAG: acyl dehydratase [Idiomarina sp.]|nr:acyl dehydratase [Idiomarina sp.]
MVQENHVNYGSSQALPDLPGMLLRAIPTVVRKGVIEEGFEALSASFRCPAIDRAHLAAYRRQIPGFVSDIPLTYFYLIAQRAHLALMLDDQFPWPILGMVHVANKMLLHDEVRLGETFTLQVKIEFPPRAATRKRVRPVYHVDFYQGKRLVLECVSAYQVGGGTKNSEGRRQRAEVPELAGWSRTELWHLDSHLGRRYARLSGDYNPIHLHPWLSRWFGFSRPIIHGMYSVARAQASLEESLQAPVTMLDIGFRRPVVLPTQLHCWFERDAGRLLVSDVRNEKSFLDGTFEIGETL